MPNIWFKQNEKNEAAKSKVVVVTRLQSPPKHPLLRTPLPPILSPHQDSTMPKIQIFHQTHTSDHS